MRIASIVFLALLACGGRKTSPAVSDEGVALHGARPEQPVELPEFVATNHLGEARSRADLLGKPTVLWFFPAAGTPG